VVIKRSRTSTVSYGSAVWIISALLSVAKDPTLSFSRVICLVFSMFVFAIDHLSRSLVPHISASFKLHNEERGRRAPISMPTESNNGQDASTVAVNQEPFHLTLQT
jgi:hypothetical protein